MGPKLSHIQGAAYSALRYFLETVQLCSTYAAMHNFCACLVYDFYYYGYRQLLAKKKIKFFGGTPRMGP